MSEYNERWTREKFVEYRKLKRSGYSHEELKEHFGEDIYHSGLYNKNASKLPPLKYYNEFIKEIKVNPEHTSYDYDYVKSLFYEKKNDHIITFYSDDVEYVICLIYYPIDDYETYNVVFTTKEQWVKYDVKVKKNLIKGYLTPEEHKELSSIVEKETKLNDLFPIMRKLSWILLDFCRKYLKNKLLSIGDTDNKKKIKLYRSIIKDSFSNIKETKTNVNGDKYYIYEISYS